MIEKLIIVIVVLMAVWAAQPSRACDSDSQGDEVQYGTEANRNGI